MKLNYLLKLTPEEEPKTESQEQSDKHKSRDVGASYHSKSAKKQQRKSGEKKLLSTIKSQVQKAYQTRRQNPE